MKKKKKKDDKLVLVWKNEHGKSFKIGRLKKHNNRFYFKYYNQIVLDLDEDEEFEPLPMLPKTNVEYFSEELFRTFVDMIPNRKLRSDLDEKSDFELLKNNLKNLIHKEFYFVDEDENVV